MTFRHHIAAALAACLLAMSQPAYAFVYNVPAGSIAWEWFGNTCTPIPAGFCGGPPGDPVHVTLALADSYVLGTPLNGGNASLVTGFFYWSPSYQALYDPIGDPTSTITILNSDGFDLNDDVGKSFFLQFNVPSLGSASFQTDSTLDAGNPNAIDGFYAGAVFNTGAESIRHDVNWSPVAVVPVPAALPLLLTALAGLGVVASRRKGFS